MGDEDGLGQFSRRVRKYDERIVCVACGAISLHDERGWRGYRVEHPELDEQPGLVFYCPSCSQREFGQ